MTDPEMCCGGTCVRALCAYHAPRPVATKWYATCDDDAYLVAFQAAIDRAIARLRESNQQELRRIGLDDPEVSDRMCYLTPSGGVVYR